MTTMDLKTFTAPRGTAAKLAVALRVPPVLVSQWLSGARPVPEDRAPAIEFETGFKVRVEELCPKTRWVRVSDPAWEHGRPLIDKTAPRMAEIVERVG